MIDVSVVGARHAQYGIEYGMVLDCTVLVLPYGSDVFSYV